MISPLSMSPPDTPPGRRARGATEGDEATKLLLPQGPLSAAGSGELGLGGLTAYSCIDSIAKSFSGAHACHQHCSCSAGIASVISASQSVAA